MLERLQDRFEYGCFEGGPSSRTSCRPTPPCSRAPPNECPAGASSTPKNRVPVLFRVACSTRMFHADSGPFGARALVQTTATSVRMYNNLIEMISVTLHTSTNFMEQHGGGIRVALQPAGGHARRRALSRGAPLRHGDCHSDQTTHRAPPIAACDPQPTTTECCSRRARERQRRQLAETPRPAATPEAAT